MRKMLSVLVAAAFIMVLAGLAYAEGAPVAVTQFLTGYSMNARTVTLEYAVQVVNRQDAALSSLSLTLVPQPPFVLTKTALTIGALGPGEKADLKVKVVSSLMRDQKYFSQMPLLWAGKYIDAVGKPAEFPIKSRGGAK